VLGDRDAFLDVLVGNTRAVAFYEKMGFRRVGPVRTVLGLVDDEGRVVGEWRMVRRSSPPASDEVR
jgi:ribosomal protein S18 acetylase RimI-like enzyme